MDINERQDDLDQASNHSDQAPLKPHIIKHDIKIFNDLDASDIRMDQLNFLLSNRSQSISVSNSQYVGGNKKSKTFNFTAHLKFPLNG